MYDFGCGVVKVVVDLMVDVGLCFCFEADAVVAGKEVENRRLK